MREQRTSGRRAAPQHARSASGWLSNLRMTVLIVLPLVLAWFLMPASARPLGPGDERPRSSRGVTEANASQAAPAGESPATTRPRTSAQPKRKAPASTRTTAAPKTTAAPTTSRPPRSTAAAPAPSTSGATTVADRITQDLLGRLNAERAARGLAKLRWDPSLAAMAAGWSEHMASSREFAHRDLGEASSLPGISKFQALGENIAWVEGYPNEAYQLHVGWMRSEGHRANMLQPGFDSVGIAVVCSDGRAWATQNFGRLDGSSAPEMSSDTPSEDPIVGTALDGLSCG